MCVTAQDEFDSKYITSTEICAQLSIERSTLLNAIKKGRFPEGILITQPNGGTLVRLWDRNLVATTIADWADTLARGNAA